MKPSATHILDQIAELTAQLGRRDPDESELVTTVLVQLPQLAALLADESGRHRADKMAHALLANVTRLISRKPDEAEYVSAVVTAFNRLAVDCGLWRQSGDSTSGKAVKPRHTRRGETVEYFRRVGRSGEVLLVEGHGPGRKEIHIPQSEYKRATEAITRVACDEGFHFDALSKAYVKLGGRDLKSTPVLRAMLRFLRKTDPPIVERRKARYYLRQHLEHFKREADKAWNNTPDRQTD